MMPVPWQPEAAEPRAVAGCQRAWSNLGTVRCSVTGRDWLLDGAAVARTDGLADSCQSLPARSPGATQAGSEPLASRA